MHLELLMQHMDIQRTSAYLVSYPYIPSWDKLWREQQGAAGGSEGGAHDEDEE